MACFIVPAAEAAIVSLTSLALAKRAPRACKALKSLSHLLWGGSALLAFEHLWHGEIQPFYPFLTAASDPDALSEVFHEMSTVGVAMALTVTAAWGLVTFAKRRLAKLPAPEALEEKP